MKSTEIVQEGPLDFVKKVGAGLGGIADPNSTFKTGYQQAASAQQLDAYAKKTYPAWNQAIVNFKQQGVPDPQLGPEMQDWASEYFGVPAPAFSGPVSAQSSMEYLKKLWAMKLSPRKDKTAAQQIVAPAATPAAAPPVFKDPATFKAEWDKFVASKPNYKLIADPALLSVLKNMWMRSGGMKAESKKNKGKLV